jgi:hypothetical protein
MDRSNNAYLKSYPTNNKKDNTCCGILFGCLCAFVFVGLIFGLVFYLTSRDPYSSSKDLLTYNHHLKTQQHGIDFYVKSGFNKKYPVGSPARVKLEDKIIKDYNETKQSECHYELLQKWLFATNYPTPVCDDLERKGLMDKKERTINP